MGSLLKGRRDLDALPSEYSIFLKKQFTQSDMRVKPDRSKLVLAYHFFDLIEIYSKDGTLIKAVKGPMDISPDYRLVEGDGETHMLVTDDTKICFCNIFTTDKYIYASFSGNSYESESLDGWQCENLFVYDWEGEPVKRFKLNHLIHSFCVDEESGFIYSYSLDTGELIRGQIEI
ncbi:hypothetical protein DMA11_21285 [Marinilabiliaceae bacterium JC017]|nr:hypothetical protein DMA11_21285 [Marinilabiliaceae bacterium JC017]